MQIFARTSLRSIHFGWAALCLLGLQFANAQSADEYFGAESITTDQINIVSGREIENSSTETPEASAQPVLPKSRRPMPTGSNLLPSPAVFSRQQAAPAELVESARSARQQSPYGTLDPAHAAANRASSTEGVDEQEVFRLTNEARAAAGLPALKWDEDLAKAARYHAADMEVDGYFDHDTHDKVNGQLVRVCSAQERMSLFTPHGAGENIAMGQRTAEEVMDTWLASPPHRRGILRADILSIGVGKVGTHWVQNFGW